jgi:hypothetical protein
MAWPDRSAVHGSVTWTRGDQSLTIGQGGWIKSTSRLPLMAYGFFTYSDVPLSDSPGESPRRAALGALHAMLGCWVLGSVLHDGSTPVDQDAGLDLNLQYLTNFCAPFTSGPGTFDTELIVPAVGTFTGQSHLELLASENARGPGFAKVVLLVTVPAGRLDRTPEP